VVYEPEDPENEIIEIVDPPENGDVIIEDGKVKYTPDDTYDGEDKIVIKVTKDDGTEEIITIEINDELVPLDDLVELPDLGVETNRLLYFLISIISIVGLVLTRKKTSV
ncbi:MAG: Ig-like domain-containing protein, partial [Tissierellales bacterium]|nr:Ig-like domain-containing protein [Tissierellales bacterium]